MNPGNENNVNNVLVYRYQNGEDEALKLLIKRFHPVMVRTIVYYTRNCSAVDDIVQDCWYSIIEKLSGLDLQISFDAWALTIAKRKAIDWIRKQQRMRTQAVALHDANLPDVENNETGSEAERLEKIRTGIRLLSPSPRIVLEMFYLENLSLKKISDVLDIPEGTVKSRLFHARENLKKTITKQPEDDHEKRRNR